jgi:hypothetical protein
MQKKKLAITLLFFYILLNFNFAQDNIKYENYTYDNEIKSVQTLVNGIITNVPILRLNSSDVLTLQFDDIGDEEDNEFFYKILHCDKDWEPTILDPIEFIDGFNDLRIRDWNVSISTSQKYTNYWLTIPNRDTRLKISGNFIIYVYNKYDNETPIITRRIISAENNITSKVSWVRVSDTENIRFKQQMNLRLAVNNIKMQNPMRDVYITVIENGEWKTALTGIKARSVKDGLLAFDDYGTLSFWGGNEYRNFNIRSVKSRGFGVKNLEFGADGIVTASLYPDISRSRKPYAYDFDFNGNYYIDNNDVIQRIIFDNGGASINKLGEFRQNFAYFDKLVNGWQIRDKELRSDYANVIFTLKSEQLESDVYIYGGLTDFQLMPEAKMHYDAKNEQYVGELLLKQGYYNYSYAVKDKKGNPNTSVLEGNWQDTENEYKTLVYYKDFGGRYDRVIGYSENDTANYGIK